MDRAEVGTIFALSWLITWYGHVLTDVRHVLRLYDLFLASHPLMPVYLAAAVGPMCGGGAGTPEGTASPGTFPLALLLLSLQIVLHREEEVLTCSCDMPSVHQLLARLPPDLPFERLVARAQDLFRCHPHAELAKQAALQHHKR